MNAQACMQACASGQTLEKSLFNGIFHKIPEEKFSVFLFSIYMQITTKMVSETKNMFSNYKFLQTPEMLCICDKIFSDVFQSKYNFFLDKINKTLESNIFVGIF